MSETVKPRVAVLAGINGAGKTTASRAILVDALRIPTFVNADAIARGLNGFNPESVAVAAGRVMLEYLRELADTRSDFAFETTLAARTYAGWLKELKDGGYYVYLFYYWLATPETAIARVAERVRAGGHHIPEATIRQRFGRSASNFFDLYRPLADEWRVYDNSKKEGRLIAFAIEGRQYVLDTETWFDFQRGAGHDKHLFR
jgi:predicted ABC-type ATPase